MLNCSYKYISAMIANRLKSVLEELISADQTGFFSNRFIGENTLGYYMIPLIIVKMKIPMGF